MPSDTNSAPGREIHPPKRAIGKMRIHRRCSCSSWMQWQLMRQYPCSFEFSELYLIALLDEVYSKRSGTFLHDCEEARMVRPASCIRISLGYKPLLNNAVCMYTRRSRRMSSVQARGRYWRCILRPRIFAIRFSWRLFVMMMM